MRASTHARIRAQAPRDQTEVVERDGGEDVEAGAAIEQQSGDGLVVDEILQRRRPMIDVPRLQLRAVIQQEPGDLGIRGAVKRGLAVAAAGVNDIGIGAHQLFQLVQKPEARGRPWRHAGAPRDQRTRLVQCQSRLENSEATGPPGGARIDVGAVAQQDVDQRQVLFPLVNGGQIEVETRLIDARADLRVPGQQFLHLFGLAGANGGIEPFDRRHREQFDLLRHRGPGLEPIAARDHELGVVQLHRIRIDATGMERLRTRNGFGIAGPRVPQQPFRQLALHLEAGPRRQRFDREARHDAPPGPLDIKVMQERDMTIPPSGKAAPCPRIGGERGSS